MAKSGCVALLVIGVVASVMLQCAVAQTVYVVGDSSGWFVPVGNEDLYDNWAENKTFRVGDILTFNFTTNSHDVVEVTEASYDACTSTNIIGSIITTGPANITLTSAGEHYYICTVGAGRHCQGGQKLDITVTAAAPGTPISPSQSPPANGPTSPTTPGSTTAPPPPSSSSSVVLASVFVTIFSIAMGVFF